MIRFYVLRRPLAALSLTLLATPAFAGMRVDSDVPQARVSYADLDMASAAGRARFDRRLAGAVHRVCEQPTTDRLRASRLEKQCRADALKRVDTQVAAIRDHAIVATVATVPVTTAAQSAR